MALQEIECMECAVGRRSTGLPRARGCWRIRRGIRPKYCSDLTGTERFRAFHLRLVQKFSTRLIEVSIRDQNACRL